MKAKFRVGDRVRIRQWKDMESEFGTAERGRICCNNVAFVEDMKPMCGYEFTIAGVSKYDNETFRVKSSDIESVNAPETTRLGLNDWIITFDMIELAVEEEVDSSELELFLRSIK